MKCIFFYHAFSSCWNNGHAHFLRGLTRELAQFGHEVIVYEPQDGWSRLNAIADGGEASLGEISRLTPGVMVRLYGAAPDLDEALHGADLVIVHEWNPPALIAEIGRRRAHGGSFRLFFHDTHHVAVTGAGAFAAFDLDGYDAVLAFGESLSELYRRRGWARRVFTWHEAADVELFKPLSGTAKHHDLVWVGNWGDDERSLELREYLINPVGRLGLRAEIFGVRYPQAALQAIATAGICYGGWLPNHRAPLAFAGARATVHVPRRPYARLLPGIPTIRMFEALACGIPLVSAPWSDTECLFAAGCYLRVDSGTEMTSALRMLLNDGDLAAALVAAGLSAIREHHTCRHRANELLAILDTLNRPAEASPHALRAAS